MKRAEAREIVVALILADRRDLARDFVEAQILVQGFFGRTPSITLPPKLKSYNDMAAPSGGTLFAYAGDRVYFWFPDTKSRDQFKRQHRRHFEDKELYMADRRFYDLKSATRLSKPMTDNLLWGTIV